MKELTQKSLWFEKVAEAVLKDKTVHPELGASCIIKSYYSFISTGTERLVLSGKVPVSIHEEMKVPYMEGSFEFPVKYGYSLVGEVINGPHLGSLAHVMYPHSDYAMVKTKDITILPDKLDAKKATLISNAETVINAVWDSKVALGDKVLVQGFGVIGQMLSCLLRYQGYEVKVIDPKKVKEIKRMVFEQANGDEKFDKVFNCTCSGIAMQKGIDSLKREGSLIELSWYGTDKVELSLGSSFHFERKNIISSQVSTIPPHKSTNWDYEKRKKLAIKLILKGVFDTMEFILLKFEESPEYYRKLVEDKISGINIIKY